MYRTYFFALMLFAMSCTNSTSKVGEDQQSSQQIEYVMNDSLSTDFYTDMKSYVPAASDVYKRQDLYLQRILQ